MNSEKNSVDIEISSYYENLDKYFKLKREYEEKYEKAKNKYIKNPKLDKEEKRRKVKMIKKKCVKCNGVGGTIFSIENGHYKAVCNAEQPCNLNIDIKRGRFRYIPEIRELISEGLSDKMADIIKLKLSLLFGLKDSEIVTQEFENEKVEYKDLQESLQHLDDIIKSIDEVNVNDVREQEVETRISKSNYLEQLNNTLKDLKQEFTSIMKEYNASNSSGGAKNKTILQDALDVYKTAILPISKKIRETKYNVNLVEKDKETGICELVQNKYTIEQMEIILPEQEPQVVSMVL